MSEQAGSAEVAPRWLTPQLLLLGSEERCAHMFAHRTAGNHGRSHLRREPSDGHSHARC